MTLHPGAWIAWLTSISVFAFVVTNPLYVAARARARCSSSTCRSRADPSPRRTSRPAVPRLRPRAPGRPGRVHRAACPTRGRRRCSRSPSCRRPRWLGGLELGGPVSAEVLVAAASEGLRLVVVLAAFGVLQRARRPERAAADGAGGVPRRRARRVDRRRVRPGRAADGARRPRRAAAARRVGAAPARADARRARCSGCRSSARSCSRSRWTPAATDADRRSGRRGCSRGPGSACSLLGDRRVGVGRAAARDGDRRGRRRPSMVWGFRTASVRVADDAAAGCVR